MMTNVMTLPSTDKGREGFFEARATMQTIETLWELSFFADRPFGGDLDDLSLRAKEFAGEEGWDLQGSREKLADQVNDYARELPLSVLVRTDWYSPGEAGTPGEFEILLSTGGPAIRVHGELDSYREPYRPALQYQNWFTPWTDHPEGNVDALLWFASLFYFGEG